MKKRELAFTLIVTLTVGWAMWETRNWNSTAYLFPRVIGLTLLALLLTQLVLLLARAAGPRARTLDVMAAEDMAQELIVVRRNALRIGVALGGFALAIVLLGFSIGGTLSMFLYLRWVARERWLVVLATSAATAALFWATAHPAVMGIPYPPGILPRLLGVQL